VARFVGPNFSSAPVARFVGPNFSSAPVARLKSRPTSRPTYRAPPSSKKKPAVGWRRGGWLCSLS